MKKENIDLLEQLINAQTYDAALWAEAQTAMEAYVQKCLRMIHSIVEDKDEFDRFVIEEAKEYIKSYD